MKSYYCENCAFFDELKNEQPCCCVDGINFVKLEEEEQTMSKDQIEEIRKDIFAAFGGYEKWEEDWQSLAKAVYNAGYRKQIVGKWTYSENKKTMKCTRCRLRMKTYDVRRYCPNCGARMKGGAE